MKKVLIAVLVFLGIVTILFLSVTFSVIEYVAIIVVPLLIGAIFILPIILLVKLIRKLS